MRTISTGPFRAVKPLREPLVVKNWILDILLGLLGIVCVVAVAKAALWGWDLLMSILNFVDNAVSMMGKALILLGLIVVASHIIAVFLDLLAPLMELLRQRRSIWGAIARCALPKIRTFRGQLSGSKLDRWLGIDVLGQSFFALFGVRPGPNSFRGAESDYALFRSKELPKALLGSWSLMVEQYVFTPIWEAYRAGENEQLVKWINDAITSVKKRHPLRLTGRVLRIFTFKLGFKSGEGFKRETVEDRGTDREWVFKRVLWPNVWPNASLMERWVDMDFGFEDEPAALPEAEEPAPADEPVPDHPAPMPPPPSDEPVVEVESCEEPVEEEDSEEDDGRAGLEEEAVASVEAVVSRWNRDDPMFDHPSEVLDDDEEILRASLPFHPKPELVYEQLAMNKLRRERLETFAADFDAEMNPEGGEDAPFEAPWMVSAVMELNGDIDPQSFRRLALRHYLNHTEAPSDVDDKPTSQEGSVNTQSEPAQKPPPADTSQEATTETREVNNRPVREKAPPIFVPDGL